MKTIKLNGTWEFAYTYQEELSEERIPTCKDFCAKMPIPGYWDDNLDSLKLTKEWSRSVRFNPEYRSIEYPLGTGKPSDTSLPYLIGTGWYRKEVYIEDEDEGKRILFEIGEAVTDIALFVNGCMVYIHKNQMTASKHLINDYIKYGTLNEIIVAVSNFRRDIISTAYRGFKGFSAGIYGDVAIRIADNCIVEDIYVYPNTEMSKVHMEVALIKEKEKEITLKWFIKDLDNNILKYGECSSNENKVNICCESDGLKPWSDKNPYLYNIEVEVYSNGILSDRSAQCFGYRFAQVQDMQILVNKKPVLLRGLTEHGYFPTTCTPPLDKQYYRAIVKKYKEIGFNWIRFHTTVPHEYYLEACDELGMFVQVEAPNNFKDYMWEELLKKGRKHASVILYCGGNEERLTDELMKRLEDASKIMKKLIPDGLFSPMQALPYADWLLEEENAPIAYDPIPHNPVKMSWLQSFSDVLQPQKDIGFNSLTSDWEELEPIIDFYKKPYVSHEVGILDGYIDLDLEKRYEDTRIGTSLYEGARENLKRAGRLEYASTYYENSCSWSAAIRKVYIEKLRLCRNVSGYDYLGAIDCHWHRTGYTPGILNEFHEYKPGESKEDILQYNGESVILLDMPVERNLSCGESVKYEVFSSIYGEKMVEDAVLTWKLVNANGDCYALNKKPTGKIEICQKVSLGKIEFTVPKLERAEQYKLKVRLESDNYDIENQYNLWFYPENKIEAKNVKICYEVDNSIFDQINDGATVLFLNTFNLKTTPISFSKMLAGRTVGNTATIIYDHPILERFPHEGWCDFQFYPLFENATSVVFDEETPLTFEPIIEMVSSYKTILKQACLFEFEMGKGKAVVCTLNLNGDNPAQRMLLAEMLRYMNSERFEPGYRISYEKALNMFYKEGRLELDYSQETGLDGNAVL